MTRWRRTVPETTGRGFPWLAAASVAVAVSWLVGFVLLGVALSSPAKVEEDLYRFLGLLLLALFVLGFALSASVILLLVWAGGLVIHGVQRRRRARDHQETNDRP